MRFGVLGPLAVWTDGGEPVTVPGAKVRALLADLLVGDGRLLSADRLVDDLWGEELPGSPGGTLQSKVSQLRRVLEAAEPGGRALVRYEPPGYRLDIADEACDSRRFEALLARARPLVTGRPRQALTLLDEALALWRGPALAEFVDQPFARAAASHLEDARLAAVEAQVEARLALGEHSVLVGELDALVAEHPLRERLRALHMRALYGAGRQAEALDSYQQLRDRLAEELGLDPSPELGDLQQAILAQDAALAAPPAAGVARGRTNLPAPRSSLVGATAAADHVAGLLGSNRLVTLTGPGGVGKTRLALEAARGLVDAHPGGVWLVELASSRDPPPPDATASLAEQVAAVLGVRAGAPDGQPAVGEQADLVDRIGAAVGDERLLLVLDNCEHVLDAVAKLADQLLRAAAGLRVLATSRLPLGLTGEQLWPVAPLAVPGDATAAADPPVPGDATAAAGPAAAAGLGEPADLLRFDAVRLFVARAEAADPQFALTADNAPAVAAVCRRLDGLPLALELAAARLRALPVGELAARLDDRFRLLTAGPRDVPQRQQTLWALIDWSWELLSKREQAVLACLSVFPGTASLPAVEAVCATDGVDAAEVLDVVARLVDHSLVVATGGGDARYRLLESVRAYGLQRLDESGEATPARWRHATYHADLAEEAEPRLRAHDQQRWLERLDAEAANLRAAAEWATGADPALALRLLGALAWHAYLRGRQGQVCRQLARALEADAAAPAAAPPAARARAHAWLGSLGSLDRSVDDPARHARRSLELYGELDEPPAAAHAKLLLGGLLLPRGELPGAERLVGDALEAFRRLGDAWGTAGALTVRAWLRLGAADPAADPAAARRDGEEAHALYREVGDRWGQVRAAELLARIAEIGGDYERASELHRTALRTAEALGLWASAALELGRLGRLAILTGDAAGALDLHERALRLSRELCFEQGTAFARVGLGLIARRQGDLDDAEGHIGAVLGWHRERGFDSGVAYCLAELGFVAELRGDADGARARHLDGLEAARRTGDAQAIALALEGLAGAAVAAGDGRGAAVLLGAATATRAAAGARLPAAERHDVDRIASRAEAVLGADDHGAAFARGEALPPDEALRVAGFAGP